MGWSSYGFETVAAFGPEYKDPERDTPRALRSAAAFSVVVYALLPLGVGGTLGTQTIADDPTFIAFYTTAFDTIVGNFLGTIMVLCLIAGLLLSMNTATMDGSRALYGISKDGMTIKELGVLSSNNVPARAMTVDAVLNLFLLTYFAGAIEIIAAGNLGYMLSHVFALTGFLLLRRDRPRWPRPIKLSAIWLPIAGLLAAANLLFIVVGGFLKADEYGYGWDKTRVGLIVLAVRFCSGPFRHLVQDRTGLRLREEVPQMPSEAATAPTATASAPERPRLLRAELPARQLRDRAAIAPAVDRLDEEEPRHRADRQEDEQREGVAAEEEEERDAGHDQPVDDRQHPEAQLCASDRAVLLSRYLGCVPMPAALLAGPCLPVSQVALLAALAGDRDRRAAKDHPGLLVTEPLALGSLLTSPGRGQGHGSRS